MFAKLSIVSLSCVILNCGLLSRMFGVGLRRGYYGVEPRVCVFFYLDLNFRMSLSMIWIGFFVMVDVSFFICVNKICWNFFDKQIF